MNQRKLQEIQANIEQKRAEMNTLIEMHITSGKALDSNEILTVSIELDNLLNQHQALLSRDKMFNTKRYVTQGINHNIPLETQLYIWTLIDDLKKTDIVIDYLQVFNLTVESNYQHIRHTQEVPPYSKSHTIEPTKTVVTKVFVIDSNEYCTMLLAEEY